MKWLGYDPKIKKDKSIYACIIEQEGPFPMELRGPLMLSKDGQFCWDRKKAFIAQYKYGINYEKLCQLLRDFKVPEDYPRRVSVLYGKRPCVVELEMYIRGGIYRKKMLLVV